MREKEIDRVMHQALDNERTSITFEKVWKSSQISNPVSYERHNKRRMKKWPVILIAVLMFTMGTVVGADQYFRADDVSYEFKEDKKVLGTWVTVDYVREKDDFIPGERQCIENLYCRAIMFRPEGIVTGIYQNASDDEPFAQSFLEKWTEGYVINSRDRIRSHYWIETIQEETYLFFEWKNEDYIYRRLEKPYLYVFKRSELDEMQQQAIENEGKVINRDDTEIEFENVEEMIGEWKVVDFVDEIQKFDEKHPATQVYYKDSVKELIVREKGELVQVSTDGSYWEYGLSWSGHYIINSNQETVSECLIKEMNGKTYMFYEWKSGDYIYRDMKPSYYVLIKNK